MSYRKPCARTLDRPIVLFGLEPDELVLVGLLSGAVMFLVDAVPAVVVGGVVWIGLSRIKAGKPPGHVFELLYRGGLLRWLPFLRAPNLVRREVRVLEAFEGDDRDAEREYWGERPRLGA